MDYKDFLKELETTLPTLTDIQLDHVEDMCHLENQNRFLKRIKEKKINTEYLEQLERECEA